MNGNATAQTTANPKGLPPSITGGNVPDPEVNNVSYMRPGSSIFFSFAHAPDYRAQQTTKECRDNTSEEPKCRITPESRNR